jgi:hypothetical protein
MFNHSYYEAKEQLHHKDRDDGFPADLPDPAGTPSSRQKYVPWQATRAAGYRPVMINVHAGEVWLGGSRINGAAG